FEAHHKRFELLLRRVLSESPTLELSNEILEVDQWLHWRRERLNRGIRRYFVMIGRQFPIRVPIALVSAASVALWELAVSLGSSLVDGLSKGKPAGHSFIERPSEQRRGGVVDRPTGSNHGANSHSYELCRNVGRQHVVFGVLAGGVLDFSQMTAVNKH